MSDILDTGTLLAALHFAAEKHRDQRRKGQGQHPYINHPIAVTEILWRVGEVRDLTTLLAGILHDTIEDTDTMPEEIRERFGKEVLGIVLECTDDKSLPKAERKHLQIVHAPGKSTSAKLVKLADKASNLHDLSHFPPDNWSLERRQEYVTWSQKVVAGLRGTNKALEDLYDQECESAKHALGLE